MIGFDAAERVSRYAISILNSTKPSVFSPKFKEWSYSVWAVSDIMVELSDCPQDDYFFVLQKYILKVDHFKRLSYGMPSYEVFVAIGDTANDILQYLNDIEKGVF